MAAPGSNLHQPQAASATFCRASTPPNVFSAVNREDVVQAMAEAVDVSPAPASLQPIALFSQDESHPAGSFFAADTTFDCDDGDGTFDAALALE
jgi:hypothetical protein